MNAVKQIVSKNDTRSTIDAEHHTTICYTPPHMNFPEITTTSEEEFISRSTATLAHMIREAIETRGECILGLSGGSTPKPIYEALGKEDIDWSKVHVFLVDERHIDAGDDKSNQKLVRDTLLAHASIPESNIVFPDTSLPIDECMEKYTKDLKEQWSDHLPDVITLGLGEDGHIASLFPPLDDLAMGDERLVLHTTTDQFDVHDRITISLNAITAAGKQIFFLKGEGKFETWKAMRGSDEGAERWPAKGVAEGGEVTVVSWW